ncbi:MAG: hypothetical protein EP330_13625 [Deltaproteobacteria bacterium]|nr:MAG: hypothetical protein EP330_13625 [Deltaproteobacteria bacterium]
MTAPHPILLQSFCRYTVESSMEGPLTVESDSIERALYLGLQLLERDHHIEDFAFHRESDGSLHASDVLRNEHFSVRAAAA